MCTYADLEPENLLYKSPGGFQAAHRPRLLSRSRMALLRALCVIVVSTLLSTSTNGQCTNPRVRKEWRSLCADERASWIKAINVPSPLECCQSLLTSSRELQCLANLPHDPKVAPTVDPSLSLIPPLTPNSSHFDGECFQHRSHFC